MNQGWIKLNRAVMAEPIFQNGDMLRLFLWLAFRAAYKPQTVLVGLKSVDLSPGQLVYGALRAMEELNLKRTTLWRYMKALQELGYITVEAHKRFSIVELNADFDRTPADTNKKDKKDKKEKKYTRARRRNGFLNYTDEQEDYSAVEAQAILNRKKIIQTPSHEAD